jgi:hypothetical protein
MLKRLWVVVSVLWSVFWGALALIIVQGGSDGSMSGLIVWVLLPWIIGCIAWVSWRFITGPRISRSTEIDRY